MGTYILNSVGLGNIRSLNLGRLRILACVFVSVFVRVKHVYFYALRVCSRDVHRGGHWANDTHIRDWIDGLMHEGLPVSPSYVARWYAKVNYMGTMAVRKRKESLQRHVFQYITQRVVICFFVFLLGCFALILCLLCTNNYISFYCDFYLSGIYCSSF